MAKLKSKKDIDSSEHGNTSDLPLDLKKVQITDDEGRCVEIPAIDEYFMEPRQFVLYKPLPSFDDYENIGCAVKEEWLQRMQFIQDDLHWLLRLPNHRFWSQVLHDDSLHFCLDSYLAQCTRDFDLINCNIEEDILAVVETIYKLVFLVFLKLSTYKESRKNYISSEAFAEMIYENYLFDIPKILDLCAIYGNSKNSPILKKMISNVFNTQPRYMEDLESTVPQLLLVFDRVEEELNLNQNCVEMAPAKLAEHRPLGISSVSTSSLLDLIYYVTDISYTINAFIEIYPHAGQVFYRHETISRIASFYDTVIPSIENELLIREDEKVKKLFERYKNMVRVAKTFLVKSSRNIITACCVQPIIESQCSNRDNSEELAFHHLEEYLRIFTEVVAYKHFICDYNMLFPFGTDVEMLSEVGLSFDPMRLDYIFNSILQYSGSAVCNGDLFSNKVTEEFQKNHRHKRAKEHDVKNLQSLAASLTNGTLSSRSSEVDLSNSRAAASCKTNVEIESLIVTVLDVLPNFGPGFIEACLKHFNFDTEKVIDTLLRDRLPDSLQTLDRDLQRIYIANDEEPPSLLSERKNVYDNDEFDIFNRQDVDMQRIHQGKKNKTPDSYQGLCDDDSGITALLKEISLSSVHEDEEDSYFRQPDLYEDEYDDTYDSNMVGLVETQTEKELQSIRPFTTPRVLEQRKESPDSQNTKEVQDDDEDEEKEEPLPLPRRDEFVPNPAVQREKAEQRRQTMAQNRRPRYPRENQEQGAQGRPQGSRKNKEKHKSQIANHNRRRQSDFKRSRGMGALPPR